MKKVILGFSALCMVAFTSCKEDATAKIKSENVAEAEKRDATAGEFPSIEFDKVEHDFGTIENGTPVETVFKYTNTGESMLVVSNIKSTCGCTVPSDWTKEVAPGATGEFKVKFNGKGNGNKVSKTVTLTTNTEKGKETVKITAFVEKDPNAPEKKAKPAVNNELKAASAKADPHAGHDH